jgi:hypothetical protein
MRKQLSDSKLIKSNITSFNETEKTCIDEKTLSLIEKESNLVLKIRIVHFLLYLFALNTISVLVVIFLVGFEKMNLPVPIIISLIGETIAYAGAMFFLITKYLFSKN